MDKLRAIKFFCRVAELKSFTAAADDLDVVPSVLSKAVSALETDVAFRLLNRTTRRVSLTEDGARYYDRCKRLVLELEETELLTRKATERPAGRLLAGLHPSINRVLMCRIREFLAAYPDIAIETTTTSLSSTLIEDRLDVLITLGPQSDSSFGLRKIGTTQFVLVASRGYLDAAGMPKEPADLAGHAVIGSARRDAPSYVNWHLRRGAKQETIFASARTTCREGVHMHEACLSGAGIARMVEVSVRPYIASGDLKVVLPDWSFGPMAIHAVFPNRKGVSAKVRVLVDFLRSVLKEKEWWLSQRNTIIAPTLLAAGRRSSLER